MPTFDQDGRQASAIEISFPEAVTITRVEVRHSEVTFFDGPREILSVIRNTYPGAGLAVEPADGVEFV